MSIQKIARLAGVSVATVSRVLNNSDTVKAKNRERVLQAIKESNYQPNLLARQLRTARLSPYRAFSIAKFSIQPCQYILH